MEFLIRNAEAEWQVAPLLVPKPGSKAKLRLAIDLRPINTATVNQSWPMPHLDSDMHDCAGRNGIANIDFLSRYWQLPVHPDSYGACRIILLNGTYSSTRALPGRTNASALIQSTVEPLFQELRAHMKDSLNNFSVHAQTED